jgi:indolepyruvate ferredoxin oxidoreductase beta subunit
MSETNFFEMERSEMNILIVGVGGQGTLLASRIIGGAARSAAEDVKVSEVHGMSQRGGSVTTYVKFGARVASPLIGAGEADVVLAFERLEALRNIGALKRGGAMVVNTQKINPMPVVTGAAVYPEGILEKLRESGARVFACNALALAKQAGNLKTVNVALIGLLARQTDIPKEIWLEAARENAPARFLEANLTAFELGYTYEGCDEK